MPITHSSFNKMRTQLIAFASLFLSIGLFDQSQAQDQEWRTYGGDLASTRYSPLDTINGKNFNQLEVAWEFDTSNFGLSPEFNFQSTPLMVNRTLYTTAGSRRDIVALDAQSGEILWMFRIDEGERASNAPRRFSGRGLAWWDDGSDKGRIIYVTPGYQMIALDAASGERIEDFGLDGIVDLKQEFDQELDLTTGKVGLHAAPIVANGVVVIGSAFRAGRMPTSREKPKGHVRGYDARTGNRLWIFHTIPQADEYGNDSWLNNSWSYTGYGGVWAQMTIDPALNMIYLPTETATGDSYGGHRHGDNLFTNSVVALDLTSGERQWHFQTTHHDVWDWDIPCAPILLDLTINGRTIAALAQPVKQGFTFVLDCATGEALFEIEEVPVPPSDVPGERLSPTQPIPVKPPPFARQGLNDNELIDFTPELKAKAREILSHYRYGDIYTPPSLAEADDGGPYTNADGEQEALLRAYDKLTGEQLGSLPMPAQQTGSPMTYAIDGVQYLAVAISGGDVPGRLRVYSYEP